MNERNKYSVKLKYKFVFAVYSGLMKSNKININCYSLFQSFDLHQLVAPK